ncbi:hypothetical protein, partial [Faecalibacterium prausnitzii]|uniref:hypothetical protein n=1 Tax=Faecalibacterium prausnitzii TaxID=853 RepID=UPI001A9A629B
GWQTHTLFYGEVSLCLGLKPFLFHQQSWWLSLAQATQYKTRRSNSFVAPGFYQKGCYHGKSIRKIICY